MKASKAGQWRVASSERHPSMTSMGGAVLLHISVCAALLAFAHLRSVPASPDARSVAVVFTPANPIVPRPVAPDAAVQPDQPASVETPSPTEALVPPEDHLSPQEPATMTAVADPPDPPLEVAEVPPPIRAAVAVKPLAASPPARLAGAAKVTPPSRSVPTSHSPVTPTAPTANPSDTLATSSLSAQAAAETTIDSAWQHSLAAWLGAHKTYPEEARRRNAEGSVVLRFTADRSGHVTDVLVVSSAGSPILDAAAEAMLRNASVPAFTAEMTRDRVTVTVQIRYALTN